MLELTGGRRKTQRTRAAKADRGLQRAPDQLQAHLDERSGTDGIRWVGE
jgi:hypothetical protein